VEPIRTEVVDDKQRRDTRGRRIVAAERRAELVAAYEASGLTQSAFARREGINFHTFVAWLGQRRKAGGGTVPAMRFREVCLAPAARAEPVLEVTLPGGLTVRGSSVAAVAELVRARWSRWT
jgi:transposase-like protein